MRVVIEIIVPLLLPAVLFAGWLAFARQRPPHWRDRRWLWSLLIGALLALGSLIVWGLDDRTGPGDHYVPPRLKDGVIVPGHFDRR